MTEKCYFLILIFVLLDFSGCGKINSAGFAGSGILEADDLTVSSLLPGTIVCLTKEEGDQVKKNELLAIIDTDKLALQKEQLLASVKELEASLMAADASIDQAKANMENVNTKFKRINELFSRDSASQQQFDDISTQKILSENALEIAEAQKKQLDARKQYLKASVELIDKQISDGRILSPITGTIVEKYAEAGELTQAAGSIYKVANLASFTIKIYLSETDLAEAELGKDVEVRVDALEKPLKGKIAWVSAEAEFTPKNAQTKEARAELVYAVKVSIINPFQNKLKTGMPAEVYFTR